MYKIFLMLLEDYQESFNSAASLVIRLMLSKKKSSEQLEKLNEWQIQLNGVPGAKNLSKTLFQLIKKYENSEEL